jgi:SAM-dependent methyltransferase
MAQAQGAAFLHLAYFGIVNGLLVALARLGMAGADELADAAGKDRGYVRRWCDAAYAFGLLDEVEPDRFALTADGNAFRPDVQDSLMPIAVHATLSAHMAERAAECCSSGERPGEAVMAERATILPWFGPMLEQQFAPLLEAEILPAVPIFAEVGVRGGLAVDLGCGNGWYLRRLAARFPGLRGVGLDGFEDNVRHARDAAAAEGLDARLRFERGDIHHFGIDEPVDLIAMNRALHHVWDQKDNVFRILRAHLAPGGAVVFWEPCWPARRELLRDPARRGLAFQNLSEHVQGNHFLRPDEIGDELRHAGFDAELHLFADGRESVIVGRNR